MNAKIAKRLRREANYHPNDERKYTMNGKTREIELDGTCSRSLYRELKKEHKNAKSNNS